MAVYTESYLNLYHGTDAQSAEKIMADGFIESPSGDSWCGHGIYFYDIKQKAWWWAGRTCSTLHARTGNKFKPAILRADIVNIKRKDILDLRAAADVRDYKAFVDDLTDKIAYDSEEMTKEERIIRMRSLMIDFYAQRKNKKLIIGIFKQNERDDMTDIIEFGNEQYFVLGVETIYCVKDCSVISNIRRSADI